MPYCVTSDARNCDHSTSVRKGRPSTDEPKFEEGHLMPDHVLMLLSIPPKYAVSQVAHVGTSLMDCRKRQTATATPA